MFNYQHKRGVNGRVCRALFLLTVSMSCISLYHSESRKGNTMRTTETGTPLCRVAQVKNGGVGKGRLCWSYSRTLVWFSLVWFSRPQERDKALFLLWPCAGYVNLTWRTPLPMVLRCTQECRLAVTPLIFFCWIPFSKECWFGEGWSCCCCFIKAILDAADSRKALGRWRLQGCSV